MNAAQMILKEEEKCDLKKLERVIEMIEQNKTYKEIMEDVNISLFDLSGYLEVAFYKSNHDPKSYLPNEMFTKIMTELEKKSFPSLKDIKKKIPESGYPEIRIVRGVYFRKKRFYQKKASAPIIPEAKKLDEEKINLSTVPYLLEAINELKTERWKTFALELFSKYAPKQFYILPASLSGLHHNETEYAKGSFDALDPKALTKYGGKYYHSLRVLWQLEEILETDAPEIWDYSREKVVDYSYGNEFKDWELDAMKVAALSHDIYSGGTDDEINPRKRSMDKMHPHYHKTLLTPIGNKLPEKEWEAYKMMVDKHMWKWSKEPLNFGFHEGAQKETVQESYEFYSLYRMVKWIELSDYLASRKTDVFIPRIRQALLSWVYINKNLMITLEDFEQMGISKEDIKKNFLEASISEIANIVLGNEKIKELMSVNVKQESFL